MASEIQQQLPVTVGSSLPKAWVVTTVFNRDENIAGYLACLDRQSFKNFSLILIDHGTQPLSLEIEFPEYVILLRESPEMWWTAAVNAGIRYLLESDDVSGQDVIILQNDDSIFGRNFLKSLVELSTREHSVVGAVVLNSTTQRILHANLRFNKWRACYDYLYLGKRVEDLSEELYESDVLKGRGVAYPVDIVRKIGLLEERLPQYKSDHEWAHRAKEGGYGVYVTSLAISETNLDSQERIRQEAPFRSIWKVLFSRRSPMNIRDSVKYFFICFGPFAAVYYSLMDATRTASASLLRAMVYAAHGKQRNMKTDNS